MTPLLARNHAAENSSRGMTSGTSATCFFRLTPLAVMRKPPRKGRRRHPDRLMNALRASDGSGPTPEELVIAIHAKRLPPALQPGAAPPEESPLFEDSAEVALRARRGLLGRRHFSARAGVAFKTSARARTCGVRASSTRIADHGDVRVCGGAVSSRARGRFPAEAEGTLHREPTVSPSR